MYLSNISPSGRPMKIQESMTKRKIPVIQLKIQESKLILCNNRLVPRNLDTNSTKTILSNLKPILYIQMSGTVASEPYSTRDLDNATIFLQSRSQTLSRLEESSKTEVKAQMAEP